MEIILGIFPIDLFSDVSVLWLILLLHNFVFYSLILLKIFNALCPIIELITQVLGFLDTPTDINGDGCFTDDLGFFGSVLAITPIGLAGW